MDCPAETFREYYIDSSWRQSNAPLAMGSVGPTTEGRQTVIHEAASLILGEILVTGHLQLQRPLHVGGRNSINTEWP